jgi:hypothetical protein
MKASSIAATRPTGGIGLKMNKRIDAHAQKHAPKINPFLLGFIGSGTNPSYPREEKGSTDVVNRRLHSKPPFENGFPGCNLGSG